MFATILAEGAAKIQKNGLIIVSRNTAVILMVVRPIQSSFDTYFLVLSKLYSTSHLPSLICRLYVSFQFLFVGINTPQKEKCSDRCFNTRPNVYPSAELVLWTARSYFCPRLCSLTNKR